MTSDSLIFTAHGGVGSVTGANFLLGNDEKTFMIDCGLFQGCKFCEDANHEPFPYDPTAIDAAFITHAHIDHIGRLPRLVREGFGAPIYSTRQTKEIATVMLADSMGVLEKEARENNEEPFYNARDVKKTLAQWEVIRYHDSLDLGAGFSVSLSDAGHILGSAMVTFRYAGKRIVFTGDLGNSPAPLLKDTEPIEHADYVVIESVYGDRVHEPAEERTRKLERVIEDTVRADGVLMIPAFSIERTQVVLYEINRLAREGRIPRVPVFLDSPLAIKVTKIYEDHARHFNDRVTKRTTGGAVFKFPRLTFTLTTEESKAIREAPNPKVIIAGSGMSNGGRIVHHEKQYLPDPNSTLLIVGHQAAGSLGRQLQEGAKEVEILGTRVPVRARIETIGGYSAHKDREGLFEVIEHTADSLRRVFVAMGEPKASLFFAQRLRDYLGVDAIVPDKGRAYRLDVS